MPRGLAPSTPSREQGEDRDRLALAAWLLVHSQFCVAPMHTPQPLSEMADVLSPCALCPQAAERFQDTLPLSFSRGVALVDDLDDLEEACAAIHPLSPEFSLFS